MRDDVAATGATFRPWADSAQPRQPPARGRPLPRLGVQEPAAALRSAARQAVRRPGARVRRRRARRRRRRPARPRRVLVLRPRGDGRRRGGRPALRRAVPERLPAPRAGHAALRARLPARHRPPRPAARPRRRRVQRPLVEQGAPAAQRPAGRARPRRRRPASSTRILNARRVLVLTSADFDFPAELPANVRYVGAVLDDPTWATTPWTPPPGDDPLVLVALSSTFQDQGDCLQRIVDAARLAAGPGARHHRPGPRPDDDQRAGQRERRGGGPALRGAARGGRGRDPRRPRHGGAGARRRRAARRAAPRPRPGRQRRPAQGPRRRPRRQADRLARDDRQGACSGCSTTRPTAPAPPAWARRSAGTPPAAPWSPSSRTSQRPSPASPSPALTRTRSGAICHAERARIALERERERGDGQSGSAGGMFWLWRNRFVGSHSRFRRVSRAYFSAPNAASTRPAPSSPMKFR